MGIDDPSREWPEGWWVRKGWWPTSAEILVIIAANNSSRTPLMWRGYSLMAVMKRLNAKAMAGKLAEFKACLAYNETRKRPFFFFFFPFCWCHCPLSLPLQKAM